MADRKLMLKQNLRTPQIRINGCNKTEKRKAQFVIELNSRATAKQALQQFEKDMRMVTKTAMAMATLMIRSRRIGSLSSPMPQMIDLIERRC